jgi:transposase InsO family protein
VTRSGFYAWQRRPESPHARRDRQLRVLVRASHEGSRRSYGSPRVWADLVDDGEAVSRKRIARLMREDGLVARPRRRYKVTTMSDHDQPVAANVLDRQSPPTRRISGGSAIRPSSSSVAGQSSSSPQSSICIRGTSSAGR